MDSKKDSMEINKVDGNNKNEFQTTTTTTTSHSLPLMMTDFCALEPGMDVLPRTPAHGPYHTHHNNLAHHNFHHHTDQAKSLQELQNEVGALLEFRDLVIETFPDLKHKMASSSANSTITGLQSSSIVSRREWEPGIRVRRKLNSNYSKDGSSSSSGGGGGELIQSSSLLTRSRSNSHSGKKEPKSGEGNGSVIQDSGFSTETSSSKEAHSASSTAGVQSNNISSALTARLTSDPASSGSDNELWNLLDVIHRRTSRLPESAAASAGQTASNSAHAASSFQSQLNFMQKEDVQVLRKERDHLMDKMGDMEAEFLASRIKESKLQEQLKELQQTKADLEEQLKCALSQKHELSRQRDNLIVDDSAKGSQTESNCRPNADVVISPIAKNLMSSSSIAATTFQPIAVKPQSGPALASSTKLLKDELNTLGRLDGLLSNPSSKLNKIRVPDSKKIAAILLETNIIELQRHLLTITVQNQVLMQRLEQATKSKIFLIKKLDKSKEDIEDLKFQVEERNIELEGTRAQIRVMESKLSASRSDTSPEHQSSTSRLSRDGITVMHTSTPNPPRLMTTQSANQISTPSMKAMTPLAMDDIFQHSSSTESAHDQQENLAKCPETPKRSKPSKIPLPGALKTSPVTVSAKPPSGRATSAGPPSNRSLTKSTSSLFTKTSGPLSMTKRDLSSLTRPDSAQSLRNSIEGVKTPRSSSSSIPVVQKLSTAAAYGNTTVVNIPPSSPSKYVMTSSSSPLPRVKRDSLQTRVKNLDSLSRLQSSTTSASSGLSMLRASNSSTSNNPPITTNVVTNGTNNNNSNNNRKYTALPVRRASNVSVRDAPLVDHHHGSSNHHHHHHNHSEGSGAGADANGGKVHRFNLSGEHVQPNVTMKRSWTAAAVALELEKEEEEGDSRHQSRDLISEYLTRSLLKVPEILRSPRVAETFAASVAREEELNLAYKHPLVIAEELQHDAGEAMALQLANADNASIIVPQRRSRNRSERPHLIGKVTPSIARTWEQLSSAIDSRGSEVEEDRQSYILFVRKPFHFETECNEFAVNKIQHQCVESEKFYDSIEEYGDDYEEEIDDVECANDEDEEACGGEIMAEHIDSLEMRRDIGSGGDYGDNGDDMIVWSIES